MTQEEKQLLLKDICARLPYGIECKLPDGTSGMITSISIVPHGIFVIVYFNRDNVEDVSLEDIKPYLRPMSSMTEEEKREVGKLGVCYDGAFHNDIYDIGISMEEAFTAISWLLERHFDINYLIEKGLALEAPDGMYKVE